MTELFLYDTLPHPTGPISSTLVSIGWGSLVAIVLLVLVPAVVLAVAARRRRSPRRRLSAALPLRMSHLEARRS